MRLRIIATNEHANMLITLQHTNVVVAPTSKEKIIEVDWDLPEDFNVASITLVADTD